MKKLFIQSGKLKLLMMLLFVSTISFTLAFQYFRLQGVSRSISPEEVANIQTDKIWDTYSLTALQVNWVKAINLQYARKMGQLKQLAHKEGYAAELEKLLEEKEEKLFAELNPTQKTEWLMVKQNRSESELVQKVLEERVIK